MKNHRLNYLRTKGCYLYFQIMIMIASFGLLIYVFDFFIKTYPSKGIHRSLKKVNKFFINISNF